MKKILLTLTLSLVLTLLMTSEVFAASSAKCQGLKEELMAMKQAQSQIMQSLVNNHETFASSMEEYSQDVVKAPKATAKEMNKSAQAFRTRGVQGKRIAAKLDHATEELIQKVAECL